jgi:hypothetical protein
MHGPLVCACCQTVATRTTRRAAAAVGMRMGVRRMPGQNFKGSVQPWRSPPRKSRSREGRPASLKNLWLLGGITPAGGAKRSSRARQRTTLPRCWALHAPLVHRQGVIQPRRHQRRPPLLQKQGVLTSPGLRDRTPCLNQSLCQSMSRWGRLMSLWMRRGWTKSLGLRQQWPLRSASHLPQRLGMAVLAGPVPSEDYLGSRNCKYNLSVD